jgi:hypothetical protein
MHATRTGDRDVSLNTSPPVRRRFRSQPRLPWLEGTPGRFRNSYG